MRVLVACEYTGVVRDAFAALGHDAWSCDITESTRPGNHILADVRDVLELGWDLMIAHPPCTYLCSSGIHWNKRVPGREAKTERAIEFVKLLWHAPIPMICIENPIGVLSTHIGKPSQIVEPYEYGHNEKKATCLWLRNLPLLVPDPREYVKPRIVGVNARGNLIKRWANQRDDGQDNLPPSPDRSEVRSWTFPGVAAAMARQWGHLPVQRERQI